MQDEPIVEKKLKRHVNHWKEKWEKREFEHRSDIPYLILGKVFKYDNDSTVLKEKKESFSFRDMSRNTNEIIACQGFASK